ncbi:unnamed protein product [Rotaria sp. Silwood2]|nr:unnamed protein product [Rotaria sp. Silwood2]
MASLSSRSSKSSKKSASSTAKIVRVDETFNTRQSRKSPKNASTPGIKNGGISRRRSAPSFHRSRNSQIQSKITTSQRSTSNSDQHVMGSNNEGEDDNIDQNIDLLNISSASTATEYMETSQQPDDDNSPASAESHNRNGRIISKNELLNQYFTKLNTGGYLCKLCAGTENSNKVHKEVANSDSNLRFHLARQHKLTHVLYPSQRSRQQVKPQLLSGDWKKKLDNALIYAVIKDFRPFGDFRKAGFQHFLQVVLPDTNYKGPHRTTIRKRMAALYRLCRKALIDELSSVSDIALTVDSWSSPRRVHFVCITGHYYDKEFGYLSKVISFRQFIGRSFALRIRQFIRSELNKLKINNKISSITTDNERASTQVTTDDEKEEQQIGYVNIDDENQIGDDDFESDDSNSDDTSDGESATDHAYEYSDNEDSSSQGSDEDEESLGQHPLHDNFVENETEHTLMPYSKQFIYILLQRARKLIKTIHRSRNLDKYVRDQIDLKQQEANKRSTEDNTEPIVYNELVIDFRIRWSSTFKMLNRFNKLSSVVNDVTFTPRNIDGVESQQVLKLSKLAFSHDDWNWLSALEFVLQRFEESTRLLSGKTYQTLSLGKMILNGLKHFLSHQKPDEPMINHLKTLLLKAFEEYCENNLSVEAEEAIIIASFLNPTTYFYLHEDEKFIKKAKQLIVLKSKSEKFASTHLSSSNSITSARSIPKMVKKPLLAIETFLSNCEALLPTSSSTSSTKIFTIHQEIGYYISSIEKETDFQEYWNKNQNYLPILSRMVRHYCIITITSVASESAFSIAGYIQRKHRSSLSARTLRYSMILQNLEPHYIDSN